MFSSSDGLNDVQDLRQVFPAIRAAQARGGDPKVIVVSGTMADPGTTSSASMLLWDFGDMEAICRLNMRYIPPYKPLQAYIVCKHPCLKTCT